MNGHTDKEIASESELSADVFGGMKYGNYWGWNDEDNKLRGDEICRGLAYGPTKKYRIDPWRTHQGRVWWQEGQD
ncbi:hypothetical protein [Prevotella sp. oral taxon 317]|jgi:hypothetical protein|uniref:hypothetical protein n=1 Tax=Prevotella sp. oral taxon 317 TaxID=652721 RepID=UPI0001C3F4B4|nr:hypothetical protein [Prevotella sp. oral taxon 317]EFC67128.1 hypothetical protein HMPREF0670_02885 [Prevotella sp. oral taxon 317 str. F0108]